MIAVSLNVGGAVRLNNKNPRQNCACARKHTSKHDKDGCTAPGVRCRGSVPLSLSGNVVTRIGLATKYV